MISEIQESKTLFIENAIHFRKKMNQIEIVELSRKIDKILSENGAKRIGNSIAANHFMNEQMIDLEMYVPIDKKIIVATEGLEFCDSCIFSNSLYLRVTGNPNQMQEAFDRINRYMDANNYSSTLPAFVVTIKEPQNIANLDDMIVDVYVPLKNN